MKKKVITALSLLMAALIAVTAVSKMDFVTKNNNYVDDLPTVDLGNNKEPKPVYLYAPDWKTPLEDIPEYMAKDRDLTYGMLDGTTLIFTQTLFTRAECQSKGGAALALMYDYFDTLRKGDHEALNAMFHEEYFDGEEKKPYEAFPRQKIYDVTVAKYNYENKDFEHLENMEPTYYLVEYRIMENDGYFRPNLESDSFGTQIIGVLTYSDGTAEIYLVIDTPNVSILR